MDDGRVQLAIRPFRRQVQDLPQGGIGILQRIERQPRFAVFVFKQPDQLVGPVRAVAPGDEMLRDVPDLIRIVGRLPGSLGVAGTQADVEHQRESATLANRQGLVRAIGVKGRERDFGGLAGVHVDAGLPVAVAHDELAASAGGGG